MGRFQRRKKKTPKNEKKLRRRAEAEHAGNAPLERQVPGLSRLAVTLRFTDARGDVLKEDTRVYGAADPCELTFACPGICGVGSFDLADRVRQAVDAGEGGFEASASCAQPRYGTVSEKCGTSLQLSAELTAG